MGDGGFHYLKILKQEPPPHETSSNTSPSNTAKTRETGGRTPAPCFFMPSNGPSRPHPQKPMPRRAYKRRNPHGGQCPGLASPSAGDCMERNQPLAPPCAQPPTTAQAPPVAGRPRADHHKHTLPTTKKPLAYISSQEAPLTGGLLFLCKFPVLTGLISYTSHFWSIHSDKRGLQIDKTCAKWPFAIMKAQQGRVHRLS